MSRISHTAVFRYHDHFHSITTGLILPSPLSIVMRAILSSAFQSFESLGTSFSSAVILTHHLPSGTIVPT